MHCVALWFFILYQALFVNTLMLELRSSQTNTHLLQVDQYQIYCQHKIKSNKRTSFTSGSISDLLSTVASVLFSFPYTPTDPQCSAAAYILEQAKKSSNFSKLFQKFKHLGAVLSYWQSLGCSKKHRPSQMVVTWSLGSKLTCSTYLSCVHCILR